MLKKEYKVFNDDAQTYLFNNLKNLRKDNVALIKVGKENFLWIYYLLYMSKNGICLVEGGASQLTNF